MKPLALIGAVLLLASTPASARSQMHMWTDKDGVVHVDDLPQVHARPATNAPRKQGKARAGVKGQPAQHWWERASDAPPDEIDRAAAQFNIPAELVRAVIAVESAGDTAAVSRVGAIGLMQLMPGTAGDMYVKDPVDPAQNIMGGTRYLRLLANQFGGDMMLTLAAYNAGPEAVRKYAGIPPFEETRQYVRKVIAYYQELKREASRSHKLASAAPQPGESKP